VTKPKSLVTGALGMLGRRVHEVLRERYDVVATARHADGARGVRALDVTDDAAVRDAIAASKPDLIVNCAGYTAVDRAEDEPDLAWKVNAVAPGVMAEAAAASSAFFVHLSSDFVFDGRKLEPYVETDATNPESVYAKSKEGGERFVRERGGKWAIVRTQWLYGPDGRHFPATILRLFREGKPLAVVDDQIGAPSYAPDVARAIAAIVDARIEGIVHAANRGRTSWFGFAQAVLERAGERAPITPITSEQFKARARRPAFSVLRNAVLEATIGDPMRPWEDALAAFAEAGGLKAP
jgi:dTDP-4-dehydrorhamnose reductase